MVPQQPPSPDRPAELLGRRDELARIHSLIGRARNGRGGALLVVGDPGIGKTSLLEAATTGLHEVTLVRLDGFEAEQTMPFAALHRLIRPLHGQLDTLPDRQRQALLIATGDAAGPPPDRFLVGLGLLGLIAAAGEQRPLVCAVDDAHQLDVESLDVLAFVGRRLEAESALLLLAGRELPAFTERTAGVPDLRLGGLAQDAAVHLLIRSLPDRIDTTIAAKVAAATGGNPLALVDLAGELTVRRLTESSFGDEPAPIGRHLEQHYLRQVRLLDADVQVWLLVAAADSTGDPDLITAAARELGLSSTAADGAESAGLVELGRTVRFRHPLVRSAAYNAAHGRDRRRVHRALSVMADKADNPERAAWHAAKATLGTDEETATRLEQVADLAADRGGLASRARVLVEAAALTPPGGRRYARLVAAAEAALDSGSSQLAKELLDDIDEEQLDPVSRGRSIWVGVDHALFVAAPAVTRGAADMLRAARWFHDLDPELEQRSLIWAWETALPSERLTTGLQWQEFGTRLAEGADVLPGPPAVILRGISAILLKPFAEAVPFVRAALDVFDGMTPEDLLTFGPSSVSLATFLWDLDARHRVLQRWADAARDAGALLKLDTALWVLAVTEATGGSPRRSVQYMEQVRELRRAIGYDAEHVLNVAVLAWSTPAQEQVMAIAEMTGAMGFGGVQAGALAGLATMDIAAGRYGDAYDKLKPSVDDPFFHTTALLWPDYVEAAARSGRTGEAATTVTALDRLAADTGSIWAEAAALRSRALLDDGSDPEQLLRTAIVALDGTRARVDLGRCHLLLGEWLRRNRRRREARVQLEEAAAIFLDAGADSFADRADRELQAGGATPRVTVVGADPALTRQERTVAELAAAGRTNAEIAALMFLSPNTVDYHLRKVFGKFGISSRRQLADRIGRS